MLRRLPVAWMSASEIRGSFRKSSAGLGLRFAHPGGAGPAPEGYEAGPGRPRVRIGLCEPRAQHRNNSRTGLQLCSIADTSSPFPLDSPSL
jgi:hypothetical protein